MLTDLRNCKRSFGVYLIFMYTTTGSREKQTRIAKDDHGEDDIYEKRRNIVIFILSVCYGFELSLVLYTFSLSKFTGGYFDSLVFDFLDRFSLLCSFVIVFKKRNHDVRSGYFLLCLFKTVIDTLFLLFCVIRLFNTLWIKNSRCLMVAQQWLLVFVHFSDSPPPKLNGSVDDIVDATFIIYVAHIVLNSMEIYLTVLSWKHHSKKQLFDNSFTTPPIGEHNGLFKSGSTPNSVLEKQSQTHTDTLEQLFEKMLIVRNKFEAVQKELDTIEQSLKDSLRARNKI